MTRLITLALLAMCAACAPPEPMGTKATPIQVRAAAVRRGTISSSISVSGETAAFRTLRLASPVAGRVTAVAAWPGDSLKQGQVAARVLPFENEAALHGFSVLQDAGALNAEERRQGKRLSGELRQNDIALRVPFPAVVADRLRNPDEQVAPNDVLLEIFDPGSLYVLAQVPVQSAVNVGMPVEIVTLVSTRVQGHVAALLAAVTPQTLTVPVRIALDAPLGRPLLHAAVQCRITTARHENALLIPRSALLVTNAAGSGVVMTAIGERARQRTVGIGLRSGDVVEVTAGLADGDVVLVDGQYALPDETVVAVQMAPAE